MAATWKAVLSMSAAEAEAFAALVTEVIDPPPAASVSADGAEREVELYFVDRPDADLLRALFRGAAARPDAEPDLRLIEIPEENWVAAVQRGLHPVRAGRFLVHGSHDRHLARGVYAIEIEAGQAFGTAHHGTTRGCLLAIDALAKRGPLRAALDVGTGSGVLAIAAAKAGARRVLASDIDAVAVRVAAENVRKNGVLGRVTGLVAAGVGDPAIRRGAPYGLVTANILARPLVTLAPRLAPLAGPGGHIVLSGLLDDHAREVFAAYRRLGLMLERRISLEGWTTLVLRRPSKKAAS